VVKHTLAFVTLVAALIVAALFALQAFFVTSAQRNEESIDVGYPTRHLRVPNPARLSDADALSIYDRIHDDMVSAYRLSRDPVADRYYTWRRYNRAPYLSATHGNRYINNYANGAARAYGQEGAEMPVGAVLAKDSFTITGQGDVFAGPLFVMEKMPAGFSPDTRDWRYTMIMPDGSLFGTTKGESSNRVEFCASCHATAGAVADDLFLVPERYRARSIRPNEDQ